MVRINENELRYLIKESIFETLKKELSKKKDKEKKKKKHRKHTSDEEEDKYTRREKYKQKKERNEKKGNLASQAKQRLEDPKLDNAEVVRDLEDKGFLSGDEDTDRSWLSKIKRGKRKMQAGMPAAIMNFTTSDN